jgi:hypothetical protein
MVGAVYDPVALPGDVMRDRFGYACENSVSTLVASRSRSATHGRRAFSGALAIALLAAAATAQDPGKKTPAKGENEAAKPVPAPLKGVAPSEAEVTSAVAEGVKFLLARQSDYDQKSDLLRKPRRFKDEAAEKKWEAEKLKLESEFRKLRPGPPAEWPYEGVYRQGDGAIPVGYRVGGTAISCLALLAAPGFAADAPRRAAFERGVLFCLETLDQDPLIKPGFAGTYDTRGWGHVYGLLLCLHALRAEALPAQKARLTATASKLVKTLESDEIATTGGWNYSRPRGAEKPNPASTFMTAPALLVLFQAEAQGFPVRADVLDRALKTLEDARISDGSYQYGSDPRRKKPAELGGDTIAGSCARSAACETALHLAGRGDPARLRRSVEDFFACWGELEKRRAQNGTHIPPYMIAPYYFHYGHTYVAQAIEFLPEAERPAYRAKMRETYWLTREKDGSWNDRVFPRSAGFGTAMAILGLRMPALPRPAPRT